MAGARRPVLPLPLAAAMSNRQYMIVMIAILLLFGVLTLWNGYSISLITQSSGNIKGRLSQIQRQLKDTSLRLSEMAKRDQTNYVVLMNSTSKFEGLHVRADIRAHRRKRRILCWLLTDPEVLFKTRYARDTWCRHCDLALYMSSTENITFPTIGLKVKPGKKNLSMKSKAAWEYVYKHHLKDYDYFVKGDSDTFIIVENLREFLSDRDPEEAEFFGHRYHPLDWKRPYTAGGSGIVVSRAAVKALVEKSFKVTKNPCITNGLGEDWKTSQCLQMAGAVLVDTRDSQGRSRFMSLKVEHLMSGRVPQWYVKWHSKSNVKGDVCCSEYPIGFHYYSGYRMQELYYFIYQVKRMPS